MDAIICAEEVRFVVCALDAVYEAFQKLPEMQGAILKTHHEDITRVRQQIEIGNKYKKLHDLFQSLERKKYGLVDTLADDRTFMHLLNVMDELLDTINELLTIARQLSFAEEQSPCIGFLMQAEEALKKASEGYDREQHKKVNDKLDRALTVGPSRVDKCLVEIAESLDLNILGEPIKDVLDQGSASHFSDCGVLDCLTNGVTALKKLSNYRCNLVDEHKRWQNFDDYLNLINAKPSDLSDTWPDLKKMGKELYGASTDTWANRLKKCEAQLDSVLLLAGPDKEQADGEDTEIDQSLVTLHELFVKHFDEQELRTFCFKFGIDYDSLRGEGKSSNVRELILYVKRLGHIPELVEHAQNERPHVSWPQPHMQFFWLYQREVKKRFRDVDFELLRLFNNLQEINQAMAKLMEGSNEHEPST